MFRWMMRNLNRRLRPNRSASFDPRGPISTGQFLQEFLLVQPVLKGLAPVYEDDRNFIGELALEAIVGLDVNFAPVKASAALQLLELFFHDFAKVASLAGIH